MVANTQDPNQVMSTEVGRYQIHDLLGQGAMATVYKAYDPSIDRTLAIKILHPELCATEEYRVRFLREAKAAGVLSHPNIVTVFDVGELDGRPYIAMELLEGTPLDELMRSGGRLPVRDAVDIGIQLARALDYAHSKGIVHRDVKPSNIIQLKGSNIIKVTDFGICHIENPDTTQRTTMGQILGTPQYMPPEQALGQKVDARSDLFSVGVVLYLLLTGKRPFDGETLATVIYKITNEEPEPIDRLRSDIPPAMRRIVDRCLKKQPEKRYQSGLELADALIRVIRDLDESAKKNSHRHIMPLQVKWTLIMAIVVAITMAVTGTVVSRMQYAALKDQVLDYGSSLAKFMATQTAVPVLTEDWIAIEVFVQEVMRTQDFSNLTVIDHQGIVRVSNLSSAVGKPYQRITGEPFTSHPKGVAVQSYLLPGGAPALDFESPILFQGKEIGHVHLGIRQAPLEKVAKLSLWMLGLLVLVTVAAVVVTTYVLARRYSKPILLLHDSMGEIGKGNYDYRIAEQRNDEFGELYTSFDDMAQSLQNRHEHRNPEKTV